MVCEVLMSESIRDGLGSGARVREAVAAPHECAGCGRPLPVLPAGPRQRVCLACLDLYLARASDDIGTMN